MGAGSPYNKPRQVASKHYPAYVEALPDLSGRVVAVTGCTTGTGLAAGVKSICALDRAYARACSPLRSSAPCSRICAHLDQRAQWRWIADAAQVARERGVAATFLWAMPQVMRDGFVCWEGEDDM